MSGRSRVLAVLIAVDELGNAIMGPMRGIPAAGNAHYTISQELAEMRADHRRIGCVLCALLTWIQNKIFELPGDHCTDAMAGFPPDLPTEG